MYIKPEPGIYKLENEVTQEIYIGTSRNLQGRKRQHYYDLRKNRHRNPKIQEMYNLGHQLSFSVLEHLPPSYSDDDLVRREQEWIDFLHPTLNSRNAIPKFGSDLFLQKERKLAGKVGRRQSQEERDKRAQSVREYWKVHPPKKMPLEFVERLKTRMRGENHFMFGKSHTQETKDKIANTLCKNNYTFLSPEGQEVVTGNLKRFSADTGLWKSAYDLSKGKIKEYKGWRFLRTEPK